MWCLRKDSEAELDIGGDSTVITYPSSVIIRFDERWSSLRGKRITIYYPESATRADTIANVEIVGRRRFLKLEVAA